VGAVKLGKIERVRKSIRLAFFAGGRVLAELGRLQTLTDELSLATGSGKLELVDFFRASDDERRHLRRENGELYKRLAHVEADELLKGAHGIPDGRLVVAVLSPREPKNLRAVAVALKNRPGVAALLGTVWRDQPACIFARADDVKLDASALLKSALGELGGRGGGRPDLAQGGGGDSTKLEAVLDGLVKRLV
jgi:alanyl-tRNA synthetase